MTNEIPAPAPRPITRALVLKALHDPDEDEDDHERQMQSNHAFWSDSEVPILAENLAASESGTILTETTHWLSKLLKEEEARMDWSSEFPPRPLRQSSKSKVDTTILELIRRGDGPQPQVIEDLIAPLRLNEDRQPGGAQSADAGETYEEMLKVLQAWNKRVSPDFDRNEERQRLLEVLAHRSLLIMDVKRRKRNPDVLHQSCTHLLQALQAFRPEIEGFQSQNPFEILVLLVANFRVANPDIDGYLKERIISVLLAEVDLEFHLDEREVKERRQMLEMIRSAQTYKDVERERQLKEKLMEWNNERFKEGARKVIDTIKSARKNLEKKKLEELQGLTVQQAGQKWAVADLWHMSLDLVQNQCADADAALQKACRRCCEDAEADCEAAEGLFGVMHEGQGRILTRGLKFAALDQEHLGLKMRQGIRRQRMGDAGTAEMMMGIVEDTATARIAAGQVLEHMARMEESLTKILEAARSQFREYDSLFQLTDGCEMEQSDTGDEAQAVEE